MSLFVSPADFKTKTIVKLARPEGAGTFAAKKSIVPPPEPPPGNPSQLELATARVAKFIPSLIVLGYAALCNLVNSKDPVAEADLRLVLFKIAFWLCFALTPVYVAYFDRKNVAWLRWINVGVATIAFPIWAYAFPSGWFVEISKYDPVIAGFILIVFSLLTAFIPAPKLDQTGS